MLDHVTDGFMRLLSWCFVLVLGSGAMFAPDARSETAAAPLKVHFIGNSHTIVNDVPSQVRRQLQASKGASVVDSIVKRGARLISFTRRMDVVSKLEGTGWDVLVLQEASATFVRPEGPSRFHEAIDWFRQRVPARTRIVLYQTWPWRDDSRYLRRYGSTSQTMWGVMRREYAKAARGARIDVAPVGSCWLDSPERETFYSTDGNHATPAGSRLAADVIARTIENGSRQRC